jgi:crossover junction endodeoxyribonuclease RuvC
MNILAVDPGIERTGCAIFDFTKNTCKIIQTTCIITSKEITEERRLNEIHLAIKQLIDQYKIKLFIMEDLFLFKNQKTVITVARAQGTILSVVGEYNIPAIVLTPLQIKYTITGYGRADKKSVSKMISLIFPDIKKVLYDDTIDAIACGYAYYLLYGKTMEYNTV